jgi:hypothetical protein
LQSSASTSSGRGGWDADASNRAAASGVGYRVGECASGNRDDAACRDPVLQALGAGDLDRLHVGT